MAFNAGQIQVSVSSVAVTIQGDAHITALFISSNGVLTLTVHDISFNMGLNDSLVNGQVVVAA